MSLTAESVETNVDLVAIKSINRAFIIAVSY